MGISGFWLCHCKIRSLDQKLLARTCIRFKFDWIEIQTLNTLRDSEGKRSNALKNDILSH